MSPILSPSEFETLVRAHHVEVYRSARRIVAGDADALDVTQQVFLHVLEGKAALSDARDVGRVLRWLAARTALAHLRGSRTRTEKEEQYAMEPHEQRPDDEATRAEARLELNRRLARLPDELRTALVLRFQENWTFAQIASEQACSEPSAHDRVKRGLERLRGELSRAGFAGFAAVLPQELALESSGPSVNVPVGLEHRLLGLRTAATVSASTKLAAGVFALLSIVAVATAAAWLPSQPKAPREVDLLSNLTAQPEVKLPAPGSLSGRAPAAGRGSGLSRVPGVGGSAASGGGSNAQDVAMGTLGGRCIDATGVPVEGASVLATSLQHDGKFARFFESGVTGRDGRFAIPVPVSIVTGEEYTISTRHLDFVPHVQDHALAKQGEVTQLGDIALMRSSSDAPGDSTLEVLVLTDSGATLENAIVTAMRAVAGADGTIHDETEATGRTNARGLATLELKRLGNKRLHVLPPAGDLGGTHLTLGIDSPGHLTRTVRLERGLTISGTLVGIGGKLVHGNGGFLAAWGDPQLAWIQADIDDRSGSFVLRGLEDRNYVLVHDGDDWSRVELENVRGGTSGLTIQLKRESDVRDIGDHQAELHGEVRDARTDEVLRLEAFTVDAVSLGDVRGLDWDRDIVPGLMFPRPVQTMLSGDYVPPLAFHEDGLRPGTYAVTVRIDGYAPAFAGPFELARGEIRSGIVVRVEPRAVLRGVLVDPSGRPLSNGFARVTGFGEASMARDRAADAELRATRGQGAINVWDEVPTDAEGRFEFASLPARSNMRLALHHPDFEMSWSPALELHSGGTTDLGKLPTGAARRQ